MTLSNFDWTDKASIRWFILLPTGHEGPYSLDDLHRRKISPEARIWAEGLPEPIRFKYAWEQSELDETPAASILEIDEIPPLPPLPEDDEDLPPPPPLEDSATSAETSYRWKMIAIPTLTIGLIIFAISQWVASQKTFSIRRYNRMNPGLFQRISSDFKFEGWNRKIFFKEYVPADLSHIWLVTASFQHCEVEAQFNSLKDKLLTKEEDARVAFRTNGTLKDHVVEFSKFEFSSGTKLIPGLYEMDLRASKCEWDGAAASLANLFRPVERDYVTRMKVVLYHKGSAEFNQSLDQLIRKKMEVELRNQNQEEMFWQDLQQKFQTLLAISLQIEQLLLDLVDKDAAGFSKSLKPSIDQYTRKFGHFLTGFVVANEDYFKELEKAGVKKLSQKRSYESQVKITAKNIGFESMKIIEELQSMKKPTKSQLQQMDKKIKTKFEQIKEIINTKIIQITEDRSR